MKFPGTHWFGLAFAKRWFWLAFAAGLPSLGLSNPSPATALSFAQVPLYFERADQAGFVARSASGFFALSPAGANITLLRKEAATPGARADAGAIMRTRKVEERNLRLQFLDSNPGASIRGYEALAGKINYFVGNQPDQWRTGVSTFQKVEVTSLYPGVDLVYYGNQQQLEYDFIVSPGTHPSTIRFELSGADEVKLDGSGDLVLRLGQDEFRQHSPIIYQEVLGSRKTVQGGYCLKGARTVSFQVAEYDHARPLIIDPVLSYSRFLGGKGEDLAWDVTLGPDGSIYVSGETLSAQLPTTSGAFQGNYRGGYPGAGGDGFIAKFDNSGSVLSYLTYLGGNGDDAAMAIAVDGSGNAYLTGITDSTNFPTVLAITNRISGTNDVWFGSHPFDAFVAKLNPAGSALLYSTYLGGNLNDQGLDIAVDGAGSAYVAGYTDSTNFPTTDLIGITNRVFRDAFVTKLAPDGGSFVYSTCFGGFGSDQAAGVAVDSAGRAYVTGTTGSTNFPITADAFQPVRGGANDAFLARLAPNGKTFEYSTYLGGAGDDAGFRLALDSDEAVYVTGYTTYFGFPITPGPLNPGGVYASANSGANWSPAGNGLFTTRVQVIRVDPHNSSTLYAGTFTGLYRSTDAGGSWSRLPIGPGSVSFIAIDPVDAATIYAGSGSIYLTTNGGANWARSTNAPAGVSQLVIDPTDHRVLFAATTGNGVYRSTNSAATWQAMNRNLKGVSVFDLALDPGSNGSNIFAATLSSVYHSLDAGGHWFQAKSGLTNVFPIRLAMHPTIPSILYAAGNGGVARSTDSGTNWLNLPIGFGVSNVTAIAIDPVTPSTLYVGSDLGVYRTVNGGADWTPLTNGLTALPVATLAVNPATPATLYVGSGTTDETGSSQVFVTKLGASGYSVVFGGFGTDKGWAVRVDAAKNAFVTGTTTSTDFPVVAASGGLSTTNSGRSDAFITALDSTGSSFLYSAYLGGSKDDAGMSLAVDPAGNAYIVGQTSSTNFPIAGASTTFGGTNDAFLAKVSMVPTLTAASSAVGVDLTWPAFSPEYEVQTKAPSSAAWTTLGSAPAAQNGKHRLSLGATNSGNLFRLRHR